MDLMTNNLRAIGLNVSTEKKRQGRGSTDFGNVSRRVPGVEARIAITDDWDVPGHSIEFREAAATDRGRQAMLSAAKGLAMTAVDLLTDPEALRRAKERHAADLAEAKRGS
jgi:metal-dependent amidase/aminoacylase/carboxypeptidase family protein